jgi:uncharacterized OsmC-like protein
MSAPQIRNAIDTLSSAITADPAKARSKPAPATARVVSGLQCEVSGPNNARLVTDMAPALGGAASAPNPGWILRGALASCTATVIAMRAAKLGIALSELEVTVDTESDLRGVLGMDPKVSARHAVMRMKVKIGAPGQSPEALRELVQWAEAHSPVSCTVKQAPACSLDVEVV